MRLGSRQRAGQSLLPATSIVGPATAGSCSLKRRTCESPGAIAPGILCALPIPQARVHRGLCGKRFEGAGTGAQHHGFREDTKDD